MCSWPLTGWYQLLTITGKHHPVNCTQWCLAVIVNSGLWYHLVSCPKHIVMFRQEYISSPPCWSALDVVVFTASILFHSKGQAMLTGFLSVIINKPRSLTWKRRKMFVMSVCSLYAFQLKKHQLLLIKKFQAPTHQSTLPNNTTIIERTC